MRHEDVEIKVADGGRNADHNAGENDQRHAVADAALGDLLTQPHDERRACGERQNGHQDETETGMRHDIVLHRLQAHADTEGLRDTERHGQITRPLRDLAAAEFAFFLQLFECGNNDGQQLQDDRRRDVRHDSQRKDRQPADIAAGEKIEEPENGAVLAGEEVLPAVDVDSRSRNETAKPVNSQHRECKQHPLPEVRNAEDIADRLKKLSHWFLALLYAAILLVFGLLFSARCRTDNTRRGRRPSRSSRLPISKRCALRYRSCG